MLPDGTPVTLEKDQDGRVWIVHSSGLRDSTAPCVLARLFANAEPDTCTAPADYHQPDFNADDLCA